MPGRRSRHLPAAACPHRAGLGLQDGGSRVGLLNRKIRAFLCGGVKAAMGREAGRLSLAADEGKGTDICLLHQSPLWHKKAALSLGEEPCCVPHVCVGTAE